MNNNWVKKDQNPKKMTTEPPPQEAQVVDGVWEPGSLSDLSSTSLDRPAAHLCPWWFLIAAAEKILHTQEAFKAQDIFRNQRIPLFNKVTDRQFTFKTTCLCYIELARYFFVFI